MWWTHKSTNQFLTYFLNLLTLLVWLEDDHLYQYLYLAFQYLVLKLLTHMLPTQNFSYGSLKFHWSWISKDNWLILFLDMWCIHQDINAQQFTCIHLNWFQKLMMQLSIIWLYWDLKAFLHTLLFKLPFQPLSLYSNLKTNASQQHITR